MRGLCPMGRGDSHPQLLSLASPLAGAKHSPLCALSRLPNSPVRAQTEETK